MIACFGCNVEAELEGITRLKYNPSLGKSTYADLRPLEVSQNANVSPMVTSLLTDKARNLGMICLCAMTEVQAEYIDACGEQAPNHVLTTASGANSGDNLGSPQ